MTLGVDYPSNWALWPAVVLLFVFAWLESAFSESAVPKSLSQLIIFYSVITWLGMFIFGKHQWLQHGEVFSVVFGFPRPIFRHRGSGRRAGGLSGLPQWRLPGGGRLLHRLL